MIFPTHRSTLYTFALLVTLVGSFFTMNAMKPDDSSWKGLESYFETMRGDNRAGQRREDAEHLARLERLRRSPNAVAMRGWKDSDDEEDRECVTRPVPLCVPQPRNVHFEGPIHALAAVPFTSKILVSVHNKLHRLDACTHTKETLEFTQPIAGLVPAADGSLCAVLLMSLNDGAHEIKCVKACKSLFELDTDIEPIPYHRSDDYEMGQEADFSADARYLATVSSPVSVTVHNLSTNSPHAIIRKNETEFPVFSVHFLKPKRDISTKPLECNTLAIHSDRQTSIHAITNAGQEELYRLLHCNLDYAPRQAGWILPDGYVVRIGKKLLIYNAKKELMRTLEVGEKSTIKPHPNNPYMLLECCKKAKAIRLHDLVTFKTSPSFVCPTKEDTCCDDSTTTSAIAHNNQLNYIIKPQATDPKKE